MDFRVDRFSRIRNLTKREDQLRLIAETAPEAEALAGRLINKSRPVWIWFYMARRRLATGSVVVLTAWLFLHVMFGANGMVVYRQKRAEYIQLKKQNEDLQKENDLVTQHVKALKEDPKTIEKEAREQLHYARPGEVVYVSPDRQQNPPKPSTDSAKK